MSHRGRRRQADGIADFPNARRVSASGHRRANDVQDCALPWCQHRFRRARLEPASGVSLSLIRPNVAATRPDIKHVFDACRSFAPCRRQELVGTAFYGLQRVQQFDHMFGIRTHYRLFFEQVIDHKLTGGTYMMPIETISPSAPIRIRPVQVRPTGRRGRPGPRGPHAFSPRPAVIHHGIQARARPT